MFVKDFIIAVKVIMAICILSIGAGWVTYDAQAEDQHDRDKSSELGARHIETAGGFSFCVPKGWNARDRPGMKFKIILGQAADGFSTNINVVDEEFSGVLGDYVTANKLSLTELLKDYQEVSESNFKTESENPCIKLTITDEQNGIKLRQAFYFFNGPLGKKLVITCSALAKDGEKFDLLFDASMKTFKLER